MSYEQILESLKKKRKTEENAETTDVLDLKASDAKIRTNSEKIEESNYPDVCVAKNRTGLSKKISEKLEQKYLSKISKFGVESIECDVVILDDRDLELDDVIKEVSIIISVSDTINEANKRIKKKKAKIDNAKSKTPNIDIKTLQKEIDKVFNKYPKFEYDGEYFVFVAEEYEDILDILDLFERDLNINNLWDLVDGDEIEEKLNDLKDEWEKEKKEEEREYDSLRL